MPSDRRDLISDLYHGALARTPEERAAFLSRGVQWETKALRQEVQSLLEYESASARFLERPAAVVAAGEVECDLDGRSSDRVVHDRGAARRRRDGRGLSRARQQARS